MEAALTKFFDLLKIPRPYIVALFVVDAVFLLVPKPFLESIGIIQYREKGKSYFPLLLLIVSVLTVAAIVEAVTGKFDRYRFFRARQKRLNFLTPEEKQILRSYIEGETRTLYLSIQSGVVKGLVHEDIIYRSSNVNSAEYGFLAFAYNIQSWAWDYLNEHRDLLT